MSDFLIPNRIDFYDDSIPR